VTRVTLQTVADRVGVSRMTVSNAFSRPDQLSTALREKVLAAAAELGYVGPDPAARALARGTAGAIGILMTDSLAYAFSDEVATGFLGAVADELGVDAADSEEEALGADVVATVTPGKHVLYAPATHTKVSNLLTTMLASVGVNAAGLRTNRDAQVMHVRGRPIEGLYTVGNSAALLDIGGGYQSGTSNSRAITWGYVAGKHAASRKG
jgi:hypothetical protein